MNQAVAAAAMLAVPLRLRLYIDSSAPDELHTLRWETLLQPEGGTGFGEPLCTAENVLFSRFLPSASLQTFAPPQRGRLRALVVVANPSNLSSALEPLDVPAELTRARDGLAGMELRELAGPGQATLENLLDGLEEGVDVLYLVAHGGLHKIQKRPYMLLEKVDGRARPVFTEELAGQINRLPLLAVLVSCLSGGSGEDPRENPMLALGPGLAARGIPAVLAMQGSITFDTMAGFLPVFFKELQRDGQIDRALTLARSRVRHRPDWWMPVLFSRLRDNRLLQPPAAARSLDRLPFEPETVYVPPGPFAMGRDPAPGVPDWETPCHLVDLPAYRIGKYPITNREYGEYIRQTRQAVSPEMGWPGQHPPPDRLDHPAAGVSWNQAMEYCRWLSEKTRRRYTLPNEAQWEKAARGEAGSIYPWGDTWQTGCCSADPGRLEPVGVYPPQGPYGCCDLVGSVREWTLSLWGERRSEPDLLYSYPWVDDGRTDPSANPLIRRIYRGGAAEDPEEMTCTLRRGYAPDKLGPPGNRHGFRVVLLSGE
jgi:formylglycine-generating enzyme required for sulfatase activity